MTKILVVEDSPTQAERLVWHLESENFEAIVAQDGQRALAILDETAVDIIISDIVMPGLTGYELCRQVKAHPVHRNIPVILLTTLRDPLDIVQGLESGADNFLTKPYEPEQLFKRINTVLENRRMVVEGKIRVGFEVSFLGRKFGITSDRQQILDLLISTFEQIVEANHELERRKEDLAVARARIENYARQLEEKVEVTEAKYQAILQDIGDAIVTVNQHGDILLFNKAAETLFQRKAADMLGVSVDNLALLPGGSPLSTAIKKDYIGTDRLYIDRGVREIVGLRQDGTKFPFEVVMTDVSIGGDWILCLSGRDITDRRAAEAALMEREAAYRSLVEGSLQAVLVAEKDRPLFCNGLFARMYGYTPEEVLALDSTLAFYPPDEQARIQSFIDDRESGNRETRRYEVKSVKKDGTPFWTEQMTSMVDWFGRPAVQIVIIDTTERKQLESDLRQAQKMEAIGQLTGGISHDFNNLLTVVIGNLQLLEDNLVPGTKPEQWMRSALGAAQRGADLTRRLLAFSRRQVLDPQVWNVNELVRGMEDLLRRPLGEMIEFKTRLEPVPLTRIDHSQLEHALLNLVINARDAMPGGGKISIETGEEALDAAYAARHAEVEAGAYVMIAVSDTGSGMSPEVIERAFEPFFTTKAEGRGTGLGLSMVYGFIKQSGGHIKIYSELGTGTTIKLYLPVEKDAQAVKEVTQESSLQLARAGDTILLVEDDPDVRDVGASILGRLGYSIIEVESGAQGMEVLESDKKIDLLFTDIMMKGGMSGVELAKKAREKWPELKILFCSGFSESALSDNKSLEPGTYFISKPYDRKKLSEMLRKILDR